MHQGKVMRKSVALMLILIFLAASCMARAEPASAPVPGSWAPKAPMHMARAGLGVAAVNGKIYAIGGDARSEKWPYVGSFVGTNEEYNPETDTWTFRASMPTPRCDFAIGAYKNKIYCIGGITGIDDKGWRVTGVNEVYDPSTDTWETKAPMPTARWALQANVANGKIYLIGGAVLDNSSDSGFSFSIINVVYDPETDSWSIKAPMPTATSASASVSVDNKVYVIGGLGSEQLGSSLNQIYNPETDTWRLGATPLGGIGYGAAIATTGVNALKRIYALGGNEVRVYDPLNDRWTFGADMPTVRLNFRVAVVNDVLYAIGGYTRTYPDITRVGDFITLYATNEIYVPFGYGAPDPSYVPPDTTPPEITVTSPENKTYHTTDIALNFTVNEPVSSMRYVLDGEAAVETAGNTTLAGLPFGPHNLAVYAVDAAGNTGASETVFFTVAKKPEPFPVMLVAAASGAAITAAAACACYYRKKRSH